jgi:DNA-binding XRE family transcriptional regulator
MLMASQAAGIMADQEGPNTSTALTPSGSNRTEEKEMPDDASAVSSLTGAGFDQEIVEELHQALTDLRTELDGSRAEAARAVKVAEQAIQSAENNSSKDWHSTVTHKAAQAAALAQKRSAEAMAKQRLAEERLAAERKTAAFWRKQAESAEEEAGVLQTRAAAAEVQRAAMAEELDSERRKANSLVNTMKKRYMTSEARQNESLESALERNRSLLIELDSTRRELELKSREANTMEEAHPAVEGKSGGKSGRKMFMGRKKKQVPDEIDPSAKGLLTSSNCGGLSQSSSDGHDNVAVDQELTEEVLRLHVETGIVRKSPTLYGLHCGVSTIFQTDISLIFSLQRTSI